MSKDNTEFRLELNSIDELFAEPAADPFDPQSRYVSGIDEVSAKLRLDRRALDEKLRLAIRLPQAAIRPDTQATVRAALDRYCAAAIASNEQTMNELRVGSRREMISALVISAAMILISTLVIYFIPELDPISGAIAGFVGIAVWVVIWDPVYNYVYAWRPNMLDIRTAQCLRDADLEIEAL